MSKTLIVLQSPSMKEIVESAFEDENSYEFASLSKVVCRCEDDAKSCNNNTLKPLELNFFKDTKDYYFVENSGEIEVDADRVLFFTDAEPSTFYSIIEFCERNRIALSKILYKDASSLSVDEVEDIPNIENTHFFFDMSIDDFVA